MMNNQLTDSINAAAQRFTNEVVEHMSAAIRSHMFEAVPPASGLVRTIGLAETVAPRSARKAPAIKKVAKRKGSQPDVVALKLSVLKFLRSEPGSRAEELTHVVSDRVLRARALRELAEDGYVRTKGQARGTRYHVTGKGAKAAG